MSFHHSPKIVTDGLVFYVNLSSKKCYNGSLGLPQAGYPINDLTGKNRYIGSSNYFQSDGSLLMGDVGNQTLWYRDFTNVPGKVTYMCAFHLPRKDQFAFSEFPMILGSLDSNIDGFTFYLDASNISQTTLFFYTSNAGSNAVEYPISDYNRIYYVAATVDNGTSKLYVNGRLVSQNTEILSPAVSKNFIEIGFASDALYDTNNFIKVYSSMIYNRPLTGQEVLQNYNALKGRYKI
jgi:hypothetical protein